MRRIFFIETDSITAPAVMLVIATALLGCMSAPETNASENELSFAALFQSGFGQDSDDDQELSLRDLFEDESDDDLSTDSMLGLDGDDDADADTDGLSEGDELDESEEALKVAESKRNAIDSALARLRKPIQQVRVIDSLGNLDGPADVASRLAGSEQDSILIADSGSMIPQYQRRTICFSHRPLYFQDANLENCGNGQGCLSNAFSAVRFISSVSLIPCKMAKQHPNCPVHASGDCRCGQQRGQSPPIDLDFLPINLHAAAVQTAAVAGFSFLLL